MQSLDGVTVVTMILVASFAIERITAALMFLLGMLRRLPDPALPDGERRHKVVQVAIAAALGALVVAFYTQVRVLTALGLTVSPALDAFLTGVVLIAGADRLSWIQRTPAPPNKEKSEPPPIKIMGTLTLEEKVASKGAGHGV